MNNLNYGSYGQLKRIEVRSRQGSTSFEEKECYRLYCLAIEVYEHVIFLKDADTYLDTLFVDQKYISFRESLYGK